MDDNGTGEQSDNYFCDVNNVFDNYCVAKVVDRCDCDDDIVERPNVMHEIVDTKLNACSVPHHFVNIDTDRPCSDALDSSIFVGDCIGACTSDSYQDSQIFVGDQTESGNLTPSGVVDSVNGVDPNSLIFVGDQHKEGLVLHVTQQNPGWFQECEKTDSTTPKGNGDTKDPVSTCGNRLQWYDTVDWPHDIMTVDAIDGKLRVTLIDQLTKKQIEFVVGENCSRGSCSCVHKIEGHISQLKPCRVFIECFYRGQTDPDWVYILTGVTFGFRAINPHFTNTYDSVRKKKCNAWEANIIDKKLRDEIDTGIVTKVDTPPQCIHGIFVVPKDDGGGRAVVDCSRPYGSSVNNATESVCNKFSYQSVDDVVAKLEIGDYLCSIDIKDAYRAVAIYPGDRTKQGLRWRFAGEDSDTYLRDNRLCMGLSSSPFIFNKLSDFVVRCAAREGADRVINYLDDFCVIGGSEEDATRSQAKVLAILRRLGFYVSYKKVVAASTKIRFLGIDIDSSNLELSLPMDKLKKLQCVLGWFQDRRRATKKQLERLGGLLAHCAKVIRGGRTFCRRIYDLMATLSKPFYKARLTGSFREDIRWWRDFAEIFNGKAGMIGKFSPVVSVYSDSSNWGFGATHQDDWLVGSFIDLDDSHLRHYAGHHHVKPDKGLGVSHINVKEMWAVFAGAARWANGWGDSSVIFITDSAVVQSALNSGRSKSSEIMYFLRRLFWLSITYNFVFISTYINTKVNITCDALSRLDRPDSVARVREVDTSGAMCCNFIFKTPFLVSSRPGGPSEGAEKL